MVISLKSNVAGVRSDDIAAATLEPANHPSHSLSVSAHVCSVAVLGTAVPVWDECAARSNTTPFLRPEWILSYLESYEPDAQLELLTVERNGNLVGVLPLIRERSTMYGVPVRRLRAPVQPNSPDRFDILCAPTDDLDVASAIWRHLSECSDWDVLELVDLPEGGPGWRLAQLAEHSGARVGRRVSRRSPFIPIGSGARCLADLAPDTSAKFRANLQRRRHRLNEDGSLAFFRTTSVDSELLEQFLSLEHAGWKGREGTSILSRDRSAAYYRALVKTAGEHGYLVMSSLKLEGKTIAMHLGLVLGDRYYVPKLAFDEQLHAFGPGHLLVAEVLADCASRGISEFDFLGDDADWKLAWTNQVRVHYRVHVFAHSLSGRIAFSQRYRIAPVARRISRHKDSASLRRSSRHHQDRSQ